MKKTIILILILCSIFCLYGCPDVAVTGDSMAYYLAQEWIPQEAVGVIENDGTIGAVISKFMMPNKNADNVALFGGINGMCFHKESMHDTAVDYYTFYQKVLAKIKKGGKIICVTIPKIETSCSNGITNDKILSDIEFVNGWIGVICGGNNTVDTWQMPNTFIDGLHPDKTMNDLIIKAIEAKLQTTK